VEVENFGRDLARLLAILLGAILALLATVCGLAVALWLKSRGT
jgi:hypothetical protein